MYNYINLTNEQLEGYLARLGLAGLTAEQRKPTKELLDLLLQNHQTHIPFENQDPYRGITPVSLDVQDLYRKIVVNRRGGYCFEMNGLFVSLLRTLGFNAWSCLCRVVMGGPAIRSISHRGNIVEIDGQRYFGDVGFGGPMPFGALRLEDGVSQRIGGEEFRAEDQHNGWWNLVRRRQGENDDYNPDREKGWQIEIMFQEALADPTDFTYLNDAMYMNEKSWFRICSQANLRTAHGFRAIIDMVYREKYDGVVTERVMKDEAERDAVLAEKFGIVVQS